MGTTLWPPSTIAASSSGPPMASTREAAPTCLSSTPPRISSGVSTSLTLAWTPKRSSLACMVAARARELFVRNVTALPWLRRRASTSPAPGISTSPAHTHPSRSKMKPRISRSPRRDRVTVGYYHAGRLAERAAGRGEEKRAPGAAPALESNHGRGFEAQDVYAEAGFIDRLRADFRPAAPPLRLHALRARRAPAQRGPDRPGLGAGALHDRLLHLLGHDVAAVRHPPRRRGRAVRSTAHRDDPEAGRDHGRRARPERPAGGKPRRRRVTADPRVALGPTQRLREQGPWSDRRTRRAHRSRRGPHHRAQGGGRRRDVGSRFHVEGRGRATPRQARPRAVRNAQDPIKGILAQVTPDGVIIDQNGNKVGISYTRVSAIEADTTPEPA